ncbi:MAG: sterol desaturase family protein, partial [Streptosporangiaceae bacterium]
PPGTDVPLYMQGEAVKEETRPAPAATGMARTRLYLPTIAITAVAAWLSWRGWMALSQDGIARSVNAGRFELAGPAVLGFVLAVCVIEQIWPAQRRPVLARGHLLDFCYAVFYALLVVPLVVLLGTGFSDLLARLAPWLVLPRVPGVPGWCFIALAVLAIDAVDWLTHLGNHRIRALWRLHAVHHSQEELSILTTYRAHPLVHVSFLFSAIPILAVEDNTDGRDHSRLRAGPHGRHLRFPPHVLLRRGLRGAGCRGGRGQPARPDRLAAAQAARPEVDPGRIGCVPGSEVICLSFPGS